MDVSGSSPHTPSISPVLRILGSSSDLEGRTVFLPASFYRSNVIDITRNRQLIQVDWSPVCSSDLKIANSNNNLLTTMIIDCPTTHHCRSVKDICIPTITRFDRLILVFKDLNDFNHRIFRQSDAKNSHLARNAKCKFCDDFFISQ